MLPMSFFANAELRGHQRRVAGDVLRHVRLDLLPQPVHAERARQLAAAGRRQAPRLDRRVDAGLAARRRSVRALREPAVHGRGPGTAGDRARVDGDGRRCRPELREPDRADGARGQRHGARVRPVRERGAGVRAHRAGRSGVRGDERDPRARRTFGIAVLATVFTGNGGYQSRARIRQRPDRRRCGLASRCSRPVPCSRRRFRSARGPPRGHAATSRQLARRPGMPAWRWPRSRDPADDDHRPATSSRANASRPQSAGTRSCRLRSTTSPTAGCTARRSTGSPARSASPSRTCSACSAPSAICSSRRSSGASS